MPRSRVFCVLAVLATVFCCHTVFGQGTGETLPGTPSYTLAGNVTSSTGKALVGVTINLTGSVTTTATTNANGHYSFTSLPPGNYTVTPSLSGYGFDPLSRSVKIAKANVTGQNFTTRSISGRAIILPAKPLAEVLMTLTGGPGVRTATTGSGGGYILDNLSSGTYTITASKAGYEFNPADRHVTVNKANVAGQAFTAALTTTITGTAAAKQAIENGLVTLKDKKNNARTATPGAGGAYSVRTTGLTPPFLLKVEPTGGPALYSVSRDGKAAGTINLTPLTDMIIRSYYNVKGVDMTAAFDRPDLHPPPTPTSVMLIVTILKDLVKPWLAQAGLDGDQFNLISTPFASDGTGIDKVLKATDITVTGKSLTAVIRNDFTTQSATIVPVASTLTITSTPTATPHGAGSKTVSRTFMPKMSSNRSALSSKARRSSVRSGTPRT